MKRQPHVTRLLVVLLSIGYLFTTKEAMAFPGRLEVEIGFTGLNAPDEVTVMFPTHIIAGKTFGFVRARLPVDQYVDSPYGPKSLYYIDADDPNYVTGAKTDNFAAHPDQWDRIMLLNEVGTPPVEFDSLRVTFIPRKPDGTYRAALNIVRTPGAWQTQEMSINFLPCEQDATTRIPLPGGQAILDETPIPYRLGNHIRERRERIAECVLEAAYKNRTGQTIEIEFNNLPLSVRQAAYDLGQFGRLKYRRDSPGFDTVGLCTAYQKYMLLNYSEGFGHDFPAEFPFDDQYLDQYQSVTEHWRCENNANGTGTECRSGYFNYPHPSGTGYRWNDDVLGRRKLARVRFNSLNPAIIDFPLTTIKHASDSPPLPAPPIGGSWTDSANALYIPKPGDMLWRYDRCGKNMHAMLLIDTPRVNGGELTATVFENSGDWANFHARPGMDITSLPPDVFEDGTYWDMDGVDEDTDPEFYGCIQAPMNGRKMCPQVKDESTGEPISVWVKELQHSVPIRCEPSTIDTPDSRRHLYFIGESFNPEEWFVSYAGSEEWHRIGHEILATPIDPVLKATVSPVVREDPTFNQLRLIDLNDDEQDDVLWRRANGELLASMSCASQQACEQIAEDHLVADPDYVGWHSLDEFPQMDIVYRNENTGVMAFGDFGVSATTTTPDGRTDILKTWKNSAGQIVFSVFFNSTFGFNEQEISRYTTSKSLYAFTRDMRLGDFNGDGVTDILKKVDDRWRVRWSGRGGNWPTLRTNVPQDLDYFYPVHDFNGTGKTAMLKVSVLHDGRANIWYTVREGIQMSSWNLLLTTDVTVDRDKVKFGRFNNDDRVDMFMQRVNGSTITWEAYLSNGSGGYYWHTLNPTAKPFSELKFGDLDGDGTEDVFAFHKDAYQGIL